MIRDDWVEVELKDIFQIVTGNTPSKKDTANYGGEIPFVKPPSLWNGTVGVTQDFLTESGATKSRLLPPFSTLVTCIGNLGRVGINRQKVAFNQQINAIKPLKNIDSYFTFYQAQSPNFKLQLEKKSSATTVAIVNKGNFGTIKFPLAPLPEQRAIVAKIEKLFSSLDNGISDLNKASGQLKIYRQAVLKKAFTGELTKEWRAKQANLPTAPELLEQIQTERQNHHQQQLVNWQETVQLWQDGSKEGKKPAKPRALKELPPLTEEELVKLPQLAGGYIRLGEYIGAIDAGKSFRCEERPPCKTEIGVAKVSAVTWGKYNEAESKTCLNESKINESYFIQNGDFLFSRANTIELVGACVIVNRTRSTIMLSDKTLRLNFSGGLKSFFMHYLRCRTGRLEIEKRSTGNQDSMRNIGQDRIRSIVIPLFSKEEQLQIVQEIESRLSVCDNIEQTISASLAKAEGLRQSILKKGFAGELLSATALQACRNDPDWQLASELLKQIKAAKKDA